MKVLLLNPPRYNNTPVVRLFRAEYLLNYTIAPPMDLAYFSSAVKNQNKDIDITLIDANGENLDEFEVLKRIIEFNPDIIITKGVLNIIEHDLKIPKIYKEINPNVKIILNSRTVIGFEEFIKKEFPFVDAILTGELDAYARFFCNNVDETIQSLKENPATLVLKNLDENPIPDIDILPNIWYFGYHARPYCRSGYFLTAARGCVFKCSYCPTGGIVNAPFFYRFRSIENIIDEIKELKERGIRDFFFFDEIFTIPKRAEKISQEIIKERLDITWGCEGMVKFVNKDMLYLMKKAGCRCVYYGIETADENVLKKINKPQSYEEMYRAIKLTKKLGIKVGLYLMTGLPGHSWRSFIKTLKLVLTTNPDSFGTSILSPYPGTTIYRDYFENIENKENVDISLFDRHLVNIFNGSIYNGNSKPLESKVQALILRSLNWIKNRPHLKFFV